ncbi:MAG: J domain-containing protein [Deltaproteobacteria bacterium]|nr:J domain-containing protein [Deltaproteobacteria bacterium]
MDLLKCYETLGLKEKATLADVKDAYRDLVSVWHPDRFSDNPRLRRKAEEKLKEINSAYERLVFHLEGKCKSSFLKEGGNAGNRSTTEAVFEVGTYLVLSAFSNISEAARRFWHEARRPPEKKRPR